MAAIGFGMRNGMSSITHPIAKSTYGFLTGARIACPGRNSDLGAYRLSPSQIELMERAVQVASSSIDLSLRTSARFSRRTIIP